LPRRSISPFSSRNSWQPKAKQPIQSKLVCADCDPQGGGGGGGYYPSGDPNFSTARERPINETGAPGVDLGSRNFNWSLPLVNLPGRAGLDVDLALFYNSPVWTRDGSYIKYNAHLGSPASGFRVGLPTLQQRFLDSLSATYGYMMVTPSGGRVEMRQVGGTNIYESQDGSYTQLDVSNANAPLVRTADGTQLTFTPVTINSEYRCTQIKDRNGNYISATYNTTNGHLLTITDTLGRVITFVYNANNNLEAIRQTWAGVAHDWATFSYGEIYVAPNFGGGLMVNGPNNNYLTVLTQVSLHNGSYFTFNYNASFGQVYRINHYAAHAHLLEYTSYNLNTSAGQTDCPRFTERHDWAQNWNGDTDGAPATNEEVITYYTTAADNSWSQEQTTTTGPIHKEFFATSGWQTGLTTSTEDWLGGVKKNWTTISWTQADTNLTYAKNPRPTETNIYDVEGNRKRTTINYGACASYSLPYEVIEYAADGATSLRTTYTDYNLSSSYLNRRIIGLVSSLQVFDSVSSSYLSKTTFNYDTGGEFLAATSQPATQHDATNYGVSFLTGRGNVSTVWRWDVTDINNVNKTPKRTGYNTTGAVVFSRDALGHQSTTSYTDSLDSFSDNVNRNTFAYPTAVTDPDGFLSTVQYNFDFGATTRTQDAKGAVQTMTYDSAARILQATNSFNSAYSRWIYASAGYVSSYATIGQVADEAFSLKVFDGAGRVYMSASNSPNSVGGYTAQSLRYDSMGRSQSQSNPTEVNWAWAPAGDDAAGWVWTSQTYDWKGRPLVTTSPDGSTRPIRQVSKPTMWKRGAKDE
jgi:YD repeat-containing protein